MTLSVETLLIVSLMMAVFAAVSTVGSSLFLGAGFERLRAGFETIKKQTAFFSEQIHKLDRRMDTVEKQGGYFFEAISNLEHEVAAPKQYRDDTPVLRQDNLIVASKNDAPNADLLTSAGFISGAGITGRRATEPQSAGPENRMHFH